MSSEHYTSDQFRGATQMVAAQDAKAHVQALPADVARCRGRGWPEDTFLAPECQTCRRWVAHWRHERGDGPVAHQEPPQERVCALRLPVDGQEGHHDHGS